MTRGTQLPMCPFGHDSSDRAAFLRSVRAQPNAYHLEWKKNGKSLYMGPYSYRQIADPFHSHIFIADHFVLYHNGVTYAGAFLQKVDSDGEKVWTLRYEDCEPVSGDLRLLTVTFINFVAEICNVPWNQRSDLNKGSSIWDAREWWRWARGCFIWDACAQWQQAAKSTRGIHPWHKSLGKINTADLFVNRAATKDDDYHDEFSIPSLADINKKKAKDRATSSPPKPIPPTPDKLPKAKKTSTESQHSRNTYVLLAAPLDRSQKRAAKRDKKLNYRR